jgi:hypothetical protein
MTRKGMLSSRWEERRIAGLSYTLRMWGQAAGKGEGIMAQYPNLQVKPGETTDTGPLALQPQAKAWPGAPAAIPLAEIGRKARPRA